MLKHDGKAFYTATTALAMLRVWLAAELQGNPRAGKQVAAPRKFTKPLQQLEEVGAVAKQLRLTLVTAAVDRLVGRVTAENITWDEVEGALRELELRLIDSLDSSYLLSLNEEERELFAPRTPIMSGDFALKFGAANSEIEEAARCLALGRDTASAFHSLRSLEAGMLAMLRCLSLSDPVKGSERSWARYLGKIKDEMDRRWPASGRLKGDAQFFDSAHAALAAMQNPWRNATMHLDQTYQRDEAKHILEVVKGFMSRLSSRMDENGEPKA